MWRVSAAVVLQAAVASAQATRDSSSGVDAWRGTKLGMSPAQVVGALPRESRCLKEPERYDFTASGEGRYIGLVGIDTLDLAGARMRARFLFTPDSAKLAYVVLTADESRSGIARADFARLEQLLTEKYGQRNSGHDEEEGGAMGRTEDKVSVWLHGGTAIELHYHRFSDVVVILTLAYRPANRAAVNKL